MAAVSDVRWAGAGAAGGRSPPPEAAPGPHPWAPVRGTGAPTARPVPASSRRCRAFPGHRFVGTSEKSLGVASRTAQTRGAERTAGRGGVARFSLGSSEDPQRPPTVPRPRPASPRPAGAPSSCAAPHDLRPTCCTPCPAPRPRWQPQQCPSPRQPPAPAGCSDQSSLEDRGCRAGPSLARFGTLGVFPCAFRDVHVPAAGAPFSSPASRCPCPRPKRPATVGFQALPRTFPP